jgi:transcription elongation factor Elf1
LFVARNGGTHLALTTDEVARESARIMVRLLEPLIKGLDLDRAQFWGDLESVANTLLDEKSSQISAAVEMKIAAAKSRLDARLAGLGARGRELVLKALSAHPFYTKDEEPYECPACGQTGVVVCELHDVGQSEFEYEQVDYDDFVYHGGHIDQMAYAVNFDCDTCGLDLDYDEMTGADMVTEFNREPRDCEPWEFEDDRD